jgi:glycosyltransferase involved in cell wall biosynthesis
VHAQSVADELSEYAQSVDTVVVPMPPLVDVEPRPLPPTDVLRLLFFGFVRPYKGLDLGLDALALLGDRGTRHRLTVVGEFWDREPVDVWHRRVAERGLQAQVELRPAYVSDSEVSALFAHHHAVLLPYRSATQSGIAPIALAAGRPVIATAVGGLIDVIIEGVNGTLAERDDVTSLADAIQRCERQLATLSAGALDNAPTWAEVAVAVAAPARVAAG